MKLGVLMKELTARMPGRMTTSIKHQRLSISWLGQQAPICYLVRIVALLAGLSACTRKMDTPALAITYANNNRLAPVTAKYGNPNVTETSPRVTQ